jgi:hypothetical protein
MGTLRPSTLLRIVRLHNQATPIAPKLIQCRNDRLKIHWNAPEARYE